MHAGAVDSVEGTAPSEGDVLIGGLLGNFAGLSRAGALKNPDRIGFQLDNELLNDVLERFLSVWNRDRAVIFASREFALHEDMGAFDEARSYLGEALSKRICYVESTRPLKKGNTLGMLPFLLKPVDLLEATDACNSVVAISDIDEP